MKYKCIIFDCDGILVDSEDISHSVLLQMVNGLGINIDKDYAMKNFAGRSLQSSFAHIESILQQPLPDTFEREYRQHTYSLFKTNLKPVAGIEDLLEQISVPICVASSGPMDKILLNLKTTGLYQRFDNKIFSSYQIKSWKPSPKIFLHAAEEMGFEPKDCAVIEDSLAGVRAGMTGGFDVYGFANERNNDEFKKAGANVFFEMKHLYKMLC